MEKFDLGKTEQKILKYWKDSKIFEKCVKQNEKKKRFKFIDGPPYTTGSIHLGTAWNKVLKDAVLRYKRMQGYNVRSQPGYDMHGLPIEVKVEETLGIKNKQEILDKIGMDKFIQECRKFALKNLDVMSKQFARLGVWMDWEHPYRTIDNSYIEGAWWALKKAYDKGLLYIGPKSTTWCWRCATALAKHELEYKTIKDASVYVKFKIRGKKNEYILIWTTTPWTLPSNMLVAVHPDFEYAKVKVGDEIWIFAKPFVIALMGVLEKKYEILETVKGSDLKGIEYVHPFEEEIPEVKKLKGKYPNACTIQPVGDEMYYGFVTLEAGSGCVHTAPGCGAEDFEVGRQFKVPAFCIVDENGDFTGLGGKFKGMNASKDNEKFIDILRKKGILVRIAEVEHEYAHCWRCKSPIIYRATSQWYLSTTKLKKKMIEENEHVKWSPEWGGSKWFRSWLENLQDWCISRQRFWGIPLPIWKCKCGEVKLISSRKEVPGVKDLHRPWIDKVKFKCPKCGKEMSRVEDILDVWLDSGAATWATLPYPEKPEELKKWFPSDFITEGKDQIRGWFNSLLALSIVSHGVAPYKSIYMHGFVADDKGMKMSKSVGNIVSPEEVLKKVGSEGWRFYCLGAAKPGEDLRFNWKDLEESYRALNILWNSAQFMEYMDTKIFNPETYKLDKKKLKPEDRWILSRVNSLNEKITQAFEDMEYQDVPNLLRNFIVEDLSRWYIKLIRTRTWVSAKGSDKLVAFKVLYDCIKKCLLLATPIIPILTEEIFQQKIKKLNRRNPESIHMLNWPEPDLKLIDKKLEESMGIVVAAIEAARFIREESGIKQRWPLSSLAIEGDSKVKNAVSKFRDVLLEQANVKSIKFGKSKGVEKEFSFGKVYLDTEQTEAILQESLVRELMRAVQTLRKKHGFKVSEKIKLNFTSSDKFVSSAVNKFEGEIALKVGASHVKVSDKLGKEKFTGECKFKDKTIKIGFDKK